MKKIVLLALALLLTSQAFAADNAVIVTPGVGVTMKSKDIGAGVQAMQPILSDSSGNTLLTTLGADAVSNTLTGIPVYSRQLFFNGTTWDRWQGAVNATLSAETTKVIGTVRAASGGIASGAMVDLGAQADSVCGSSTGSCSLIALIKFLNNAAIAATPAGTNTIGNFGFDPSSGKGTPTSTFLALPATTTTQIVALSGSTKTYVTSYRVLAGGTVNVTFKTGTGSNCGTGTATLEGPWPLTAQAGMTVGSGTGPVLIAGAGLALCITTDASVTGGVALSYQQF
jgi:hypothetical protein